MVDNGLNTFYRNKRIFVTGHTGFKGSWMLTWLNFMGCIVKGYALEPENKNDLFNIIDGNSSCESIIADIREKEKLKNEILKFKPDLIFHMAAQPLVRASYADPVGTYEVNILGTANVLEAARFLPNKCSVVVITTDKVYANKEINHLYSEDDVLGGYDPYSSSKAAAELVTSGYRNSFFNLNNYNTHKKSIATARAGNVIGGGDWSTDRIIPDIINSIQKNEKIIVRNPNAVRPWQHVLEPVSGYLQLGKKLYEDAERFSGAWNFGPKANENLTVKDIVELAIINWGNGTYQTPDLKDQPHESTLLMLNIEKVEKILGWKPKYTVKQAVEKTISWYKQPLQERKEFTYKQLEEYIN